MCRTEASFESYCRYSGCHCIALELVVFCLQELCRVLPSTATVAVVELAGSVTQSLCRMSAKCSCIWECIGTLRQEGGNVLHNLLTKSVAGADVHRCRLILSQQAHISRVTPLAQAKNIASHNSASVRGIVGHLNNY